MCEAQSDCKAFEFTHQQTREHEYFFCLGYYDREEDGYYRPGVYLGDTSTNPVWCRVDVENNHPFDLPRTSVKDKAQVKENLRRYHPFHATSPEVRPDPTFNPYGRLRPDAMLYWAAYADWAFYPYITQFMSIQDLMVKVVEADIHQITSNMKVFNDRAIVRSAQKWSRLFGTG